MVLIICDRYLRARKPILLVDDSPASERVIKLFLDGDVDFVKYHIKNFEESCCVELPTTKAPSVIAVEGIFRDESVIASYVEFVKQKKSQVQEKVNTDSSFW
ncbi:hypothetical protein YTPLAS21_03100 [Candidatus Nitrosocosmicus sp.]|nr:hypothetical protein YTPLAS21_03100 [Candidatus Nitrosocosmicus sp.]